MENKFNLRRFCKYFIYDIKNVWKNNSMFLFFFGIFPVVFYVISVIYKMVFASEFAFFFKEGLRLGEGARFAVFLLAFTIFLFRLPSGGYGMLTDKAKGSAWLMLPASRAEKFTSMILNTHVLFPLAFLVCYAFFDAMVCVIDPSCGTPLASYLFRNGGMFEIDNEFYINGFWLIAFYVLLQVSVMLIGALIFKKWKIMGTLLSCFVLTMAFTLVVGSVGVNWQDCMETLLMKFQDNPDFCIHLFMNIYLFIFVFGCGIWSWFRVKRLQH